MSACCFQSFHTAHSLIAGLAKQSPCTAPTCRLVKDRAKWDFQLKSSLVKRLLKACIDGPLPFKLQFGCAFQATPQEDLARTARPIPSSMFKVFDVITVDDAMELVEHYAATG